MWDRGVSCDQGGRGLEETDSLVLCILDDIGVGIVG